MKVENKVQVEIVITLENTEIDRVREILLAVIVGDLAQINETHRSLANNLEHRINKKIWEVRYG